MKKKEEECENPVQSGSLLAKKETKKAEGNRKVTTVTVFVIHLRQTCGEKEVSRDIWGEKRSESVPVPHVAIFIPIFLN